MTKTTGLGDNAYVSGVDISGDTQALGSISTPRGTIDVTAINKSAYERLYGLRDGQISWTSFFNDADDGTHDTLSALPTADVVTTYARGTDLGAPAFCMVAKQIGYDPTRGNDGSLTMAVSAQANAYGADWGVQLTAGLRTDTAATNGTAVDTAASADFGAVAYLQVASLTGTDATITVEDSADGTTFAAVTGLTFTEVTAAPASERIATTATATVRRYLRVATSTTGGFTSITFSVVVAKYTAARAL